MRECEAPAAAAASVLMPGTEVFIVMRGREGAEPEAGGPLPPDANRSHC